MRWLALSQRDVRRELRSYQRLASCAAEKTSRRSRSTAPPKQRHRFEQSCWCVGAWARPGKRGRPGGHEDHGNRCNVRVLGHHFENPPARSPGQIRVHDERLPEIYSAALPGSPGRWSPSATSKPSAMRNARYAAARSSSASPINTLGRIDLSLLSGNQCRCRPGFCDFCTFPRWWIQLQGNASAMPIRELDRCKIASP